MELIFYKATILLIKGVDVMPFFGRSEEVMTISGPMMEPTVVTNENIVRVTAGAIVDVFATVKIEDGVLSRLQDAGSLAQTVDDNTTGYANRLLAFMTNYIINNETYSGAAGMMSEATSEVKNIVWNYMTANWASFIVKMIPIVNIIATVVTTINDMDVKLRELEVRERIVNSVASMQNKIRTGVASVDLILFFNHLITTIL